MGFGVDRTGSDNGVSGIGGSEPDYDSHSSSDDHSRSDFDRLQKEATGKDVYEGQSHGDDGDDKNNEKSFFEKVSDFFTGDGKPCNSNDSGFSRSDFDKQVRRSTGSDVYGGKFPTTSDDDKSKSNKKTVIMVPDPFNPGEYFTIQMDRLLPGNMWVNKEKLFTELGKSARTVVAAAAGTFVVTYKGTPGSKEIKATAATYASAVTAATTAYGEYEDLRGSNIFDTDFGIGHTSGNLRF